LQIATIKKGEAKVWVGYDSQRTQNWIKEISDLITVYFYLTLFPKILHRYQGKRGETLKVSV
jgi:hypothetical protein